MESLLWGLFVTLVLHCCVQCLGSREAEYEKQDDRDRTLSFSFLKDYMTVEPESYMNTPEIIRHNGFPAEVHHVTTEDGYILGLHRIPHGHDEKEYSPSKVPILIPNYIMCCSSAEWVINLRNQSLGYVLADAGFDVWLGNYRGDRYSSTHAKLSNRTREFWTFSFDEMGYYDIPAMIDYIRKTTGYDKIFLTAMTFGSIPALVGLAERPEYNDKLRAAVILSPASDLQQGKLTGAAMGLSRVIGPTLNWVADNLIISMYFNPEIFNILGPPLMKFLLPLLWPTVMPYAATVVGGVPMVSLNSSRAHIYAGHTPQPFTLRMFAQIFQYFTLKGSAWYDWGEEGNMKRYGQPIPPMHDFTKVTVPMLIPYCQHDIITAKPEAEILASKVRQAELYEIPDPEWSHIHYVFGLNGKDVLFGRIIKFLRGFQ